MQTHNPFDIYSSKVKRFYIPLPSFDFFHKSSSEDEVDSKFIGRYKSSKRLYAWLTEERTCSGSYLITGFRGMGKSSFVGRVLYELSSTPNGYCMKILGHLSFFLIIFATFFILYDSQVLMNVPMNIALICFCILLILCLYNRYRLKAIYRRCFICVRVFYELFCNPCQDSIYKNINVFERVKLLKKCIVNTSVEWELLEYELYKTNIWKKSFKRICISINLGHEVLNEKDVLSLLADQLYNRYKNYVYSPIANCFHWGIHVMSFLLFFIIIKILILKTIESININFFFDLTNSSSSICLFFMDLLLSIIFYAIIYLLVLPKSYLTQHRILTQLKFLKDRIDSQIELERTSNWSTKNVSESSSWGWSTSSKHKKNYPFADVRDIEQELVDILEIINRSFFSPNFIFVFDELDKIDSDIKVEDRADLEYSNEKSFQGGGTSRRRKRNVLHLLANMKLFVSTAKAKFIFISGRELYDAYLADLSDREFSISSIFNGVIYVESFCKSDRREKDIMSNAETYISRLVIPKSYIWRNHIESLISLKYSGKKFERQDINLKTYYKYLMMTYESFYLKKVKNKEERAILLHDARNCIDKAIILLYHFSVYLYHISNGSPKKMCLYFEKYIRKYPVEQMSLNKWNYKSSMLMERDINIRIKEKASFGLSFGYVDQRLIGFIHFISFPVTQIITNAQQFGDKLLVSASFLVDHIYKFHKSGFSWRNLEHTPELLEVYRIPEFRSFINSILSYLTQSHIIPVTCGLFQYKFRKQISEEISLASKFSEEIAALFNFTLDESLSVKKHYIEMLDYYNQLKSQEVNDNSHVLAGIHVILADLFMADEEYTKAIFEYQTAINIILKDNRLNNQTIHDQQIITNMLFLTRNLLKLGNAFEKRKTYESAYITYNELIGRLIDFRYLDEQSLGLNYAIQKKNGAHEAVLYSGEHIEIANNLQKKVVPEIIDSTENPPFKKYLVHGSDLITDFSHQLTREKNVIIQRLSMLEDIRLIYQAILSKLFVLEKIELGGITRANIDLLEGEFRFLHLATNDKNKFLISTDFFRRLGDIMFYKNGLIYEYNDLLTDENSKDKFYEGIYYWGYSKTEVLDFCNRNECYDLKQYLLDNFMSFTNKDIEDYLKKSKSLENSWLCNKIKFTFSFPLSRKQKMLQHFLLELGTKLKELPVKSILACNQHRAEMWKNNKHLPCVACKYYHYSLSLLLKNLCNIDIEQIAKEKEVSKTIIILKLLVNPGYFKSLRQNFMIQLAEVLDCMGNVLLSCASNKEKVITDDFLDAFLSDIKIYNSQPDKSIPTDELKLLKLDQMTKMERCLVYFWESAMFFRIGDDLKKTSGGLKKILRVILNYLRIADNEQPKIIIGEYLNEIKNRILKQCLINLYSYYNFINIIEIQKLKWVFSVQMYESISLNRLSMFPDVEEVMLNYYEMLSLCIVNKCQLGIPQKLKEKDCPYDDLFQRNHDFRIRLASVYRNICLSPLRMESTLYEKVLSLRFKAMMNKIILHHLFEVYYHNLDNDYNDPNFSIFIADFLKVYLKGAHSLKDKLGEYAGCFVEVLDFSHQTLDGGYGCQALSLLEYLIKDSMFCLTRILEIITPYTATTLFTNTFLGEVYHRLFEWNQLFDAVYVIYKSIEIDDLSIQEDDQSLQGSNWEIGQYYPCVFPGKTAAGCKYAECQIRDTNSYNNVQVRNLWRSRCPYYNVKCEHKLTSLEKLNFDIKIKKGELTTMLHKVQKSLNRNLSYTFFNDVLRNIGKSNVHYTLSNYSAEMALKFYRQALDMHTEGKSYKEMVKKMYYLDDDLKNDTIQFDTAIERFRINNNNINENINWLLEIFRSASIYDIENFCVDNETNLSLKNRFHD